MSDEWVFEATVREGVCRLSRPGTRWLSTGWNGGESTGDVAYNVTVPEGWPETDLGQYVRRRLDSSNFKVMGPTLLTGVEQHHARRARLDGVEAVVTAGVSNPAALPMPDEFEDVNSVGDDSLPSGEHDPVGTVNVFVGTIRSLDAGALPNLLTVAAEAKAATLLSVAGVPGTTTDAVVAAADPDGPEEAFSGSATPVGRAARACVRDALLASLASRYDGESPPSTDEAPYGVATDARAQIARI